MGYLTLGVLILTVVGLGFGALFGMLRGRNRAILRLVLIVVSVALAIALRGVVTDLIMDIDFGGGTLKQMLSESFTQGDSALPESFQTLIFSLIEVMIGLIAFFLLFIVLRLLTWMIVYPICKIFVKKGEKKRKGFGALIGLAQGLIIAVAVWGPFTGIIMQMDKLSKIEMQGERVVQLPDELGVDEYVNSPFGKVYNGMGGWLFDILSSTTTEDGKSVSIEDTCDVVEALAGVGDVVNDLQGSIELIGKADATNKERMDAMKGVGQKLIELDEKIESLSDDAKTLVNDLLADTKELLKDENGEIPPEIEEIFNDIDVDNLNLGALGGAVNGVANYLEKTDEDYTGTEEVTQDEVNAIVNGLASSSLVLGLAETGNIVTIDTEHQAMFSTAVDNTTLSAEDKDALRTLLGLN